jgi:hypothetical protein
MDPVMQQRLVTAGITAAIAAGVLHFVKNKPTIRTAAVAIAAVAVARALPIPFVQPALA